MRKIFITIPSLNEGKNISFVTKTIDRGLSDYFPRFQNSIVNVDSNSSDDTVKNFNSTKTNALKISLKCPKSKVGKGFGIYTGFKYGIKRKGDYFAMIDADLKSINKEWVKKLLQPVVNGADYVVPLYARNRYEGNTTNHFSSPIIYACFGYDLVQPIAGDFALSRNLTKATIRSFSIPNDFLYGVDSLISLTALLGKYKIKQQVLEKKIHNSSFGKINKIFMGEACSTFYLINKNRRKILNMIKTVRIAKLLPNRISDEKFISKPKTKESNETYKFALNEIKKFNYTELVNKNYVKVLQTNDYVISSKLWADILTDFLVILLTRKLIYKDVLELTQSLLPLYLLRVLTYFKEINNRSALEADTIIKRQKRLTKTLLLNKLNI